MKILTDRKEIALAMNFGKYPVLELDVTKNQFKIGSEIHGFTGSKVRIDTIYQGEHLYYDGNITWYIDEQVVEVSGHGTCLKAGFGYYDIIEDLENANAPIVDANQEFILILHNSITQNAYVIKMKFGEHVNVHSQTMLKAEKLPIELFGQLIGGLKRKTKVLAAKFEPTKMHIYDVKTTGKHPVHLIEGGEYITEDEREFDQSGDMGWFWLNQKEYDYFKSQIKEVEI